MDKLSDEVKEFILEYCFYNDERYIASLKNISKQKPERTIKSPLTNFCLLMFPPED